MKNNLKRGYGGREDPQEHVHRCFLENFESNSNADIKEGREDPQEHAHRCYHISEHHRPICIVVAAVAGNNAFYYCYC